MKYDRQIELIEDYIENLPQPDDHQTRCKKSLIIHEGIINWTARDILDECLMHPKSSPIKVIENYITKMDDYSCIGSVDASEMFSTAKILAEDLLDQLLAMK